MQNIRHLICLAIVFLLSDTFGEDVKETANIEEILFKKPSTPRDAFFCLFFQSSGDLHEKLVVSEAKKEGQSDENMAKYNGEWKIEVPTQSAIKGDYALVLKSKAKHHAISTRLLKPIDFTAITTLVVQYEVKFQNGMECGGAYIKLLMVGLRNLREFGDTSSYTIMFGPDRCGSDNKMHFIIRYKNPISGEYEEKHAKKTKTDFSHVFSDKRTHLFTLVLKADNSFEIHVDQSLLNYGNLMTDMEPSITPPKEIDDPSDEKPKDWDERAKIVDATATKPDDWDESQVEKVADTTAVKPEGWLEDEPLLMADPTSTKPTDWDSDMDGEWEPTKIDNPKCKEAPGCGEWKPPMIKNPLYKGKWSPPMVDNPNYKGKWSPRKVPNPNFFEDNNPFVNLSPIDALGMELWSMTDEIVFDNFILVDNKEDADAFAAETWLLKKVAEKKADPGSHSVLDVVYDTFQEKPWVIALTAACVLIPTIFIIYFCCCRSNPIDHVSRTQYAKVGDEEDEDAGEPKEVADHTPVGDGDNVGVDRADLESDDEVEIAPEEAVDTVNGKSDSEEEVEVIEEKTTVTKKRVKKST